MAEFTKRNPKKFNRLSMAAILLAGSFIAILNQTLLITATPHIMDEFNLSENAGQWVTTIFMLVNGIMIPITAFLMETYTTRRLFLTAMLVFIAGTVFCALSVNFPILMVGRVIQATGAGILMPLMMTVFMLIFPLERRGLAMGMAGLVISFAPGIGPSLSGWLVDILPWRFLFYLILPFAVIDLVFAYFFMKDVISRTFPKLDILSICLSVVGFGGLLFGFSLVGDFGWQNLFVLTSIPIGLLSLLFFAMRQLKLKEPMLDIRVLKYKMYTVTLVISMIAFTMLISAETILPLYMQLMAGFTAFESGLMILPGALIMGVLSPIVGNIFDRIGARWLLITGLFIVSVTTLFFTQLSTETSLLYLQIAYAIRMIGISFIMMPSTTAGLNQLPDRLMPHGTAVTNTMRQVSASIGTATLITIMSLAALNPDSGNPEALVHGVNITFYTATIISAAGLILALFVNDRKKVTVKTAE